MNGDQEEGKGGLGLRVYECSFVSETMGRESFFANTPLLLPGDKMAPEDNLFSHLMVGCREWKNTELLHELNRSKIIL